MIFRPKKEPLSFWRLQLFGWSLYAVYDHILYFSYRHSYTWHLFLWNTLLAVSGFLISTGMRLIYRRIRYQSIPMLWLILIILLVTVAGTNVWWVVDKGLDLIMKQESDTVVPTTWRYYMIYAYLWGSILFTWSVLYFGLKFWNEWSLQKETTERAKVLANRAHLQMIRYQINPHFLFNTLNSIRALIEENEKNAKEMITELSEFLRYSLVSSQYTDVPLSEEIEAIRHYFAIEKKRYEDKLVVEIEVEPLAEDYPVLSFLIHPLVENAIRYGMRSSPMPLRISVKASVVNDRLTVEVCNTGKWLEPIPDKNHDQQNGKILENVRQRLENAFPNNHRFTIEESKDGMCVRMEIIQRISGNTNA